METKEKISLVKKILDKDNEGIQVKRLRTDEGFIERTSEAKIILTEDNKELLKD